MCSLPVTQNSTSYLKRCWFVWCWQEAWTTKLLITTLIRTLLNRLSGTDRPTVATLALPSLLLQFHASKTLLVNWAWVCPAPGRQRQEDHHKLNVSLGTTEHSRAGRAHKNKNTQTNQTAPSPFIFVLYWISDVTSRGYNEQNGNHLVHHFFQVYRGVLMREHASCGMRVIELSMKWVHATVV